MTKSNECTCPSGDGSLRHPCPAHPASVELAGVAANLTFINGRPAMCGCQVEYSSGGGEYSDVIYVTLCAKHSGSAILDLVATNRIALTPEYEGQWHADLYLDREIPLAKAEGATPAEAVLALMSAERIDPEQESVEQAGGDERVVDGKPRATKCPDCGEGDLMPGDLCACGYETDPAAGYACSECDGSGEGCVGEVCRECDGTGWFVTPEQARATLAQPSPAQAEQAEAERPEAVAWQYRVTAGPQTGWSLWHPGKGEEFERSYTVERRPLMTVAQYDRIVGELRAVIAQLRQHKNDYMDSGQETYRALQNEIREREAEIARLDGLVSGRTAERDAALAEVERLRESKGDPSGSFDRCMKMMYERDENAKRLDAALARVAELEKGTVYVEARQCDECQHVGINDSADGLAACHDCDWTGPEPDEDKCPDCQRENCMAAACPQCGARYVLVASEEIAAPVAQAQPEETPGEILAAKLIETWVAKHGKPAPWSKIVEITALATNMPNDERERLLALDDDVDAQAQHSVPEGVRELLEMLVASDLRKIRYAGAWRREVHDRASSILALLAAAPGKEGL
ncbi:hypothetical protein [Pseudomonas aeruginosa]|uniref:hypothetical protein n=1 Tax=Pseudomonas aeruginosa TaxID=287 RepID=UPI0029C081D8|nr:hypothetical protein [Pseudomonas aeruginosa]HCF0091181.1 hypothetical protein [Pseudomonas aeruginosa]